jgi:hypothetical protein
MIKRIVTTLLLVCLVLFFNVPANATSFESQIITDPEKSWTITFNNEVSFESPNRNAIYIVSANGDKHPVSLTVSDDSKKITVHPTEPYTFGTLYTLVIPKEFVSKKGDKLKLDVKKQFQLQGTHILTISATLNPLFTNVIVQGTSNVTSMKVSVNGTAEETIHPSSNHQFQRGMLGLAVGDQLIIRAFDRHGDLLETQNYEVK